MFVQFVVAAILSHYILTVISVYPFDPIYYNLIDATPKCYSMNLCNEYGEWGKSINSVHPSSEERTLHMIRNIARLFGDEFKSSKYGKLSWGYVGSEYSWDSGNYCGQTTPYPAYWYSMANQLARFHQWDKLTCDVSMGHNTCENPDRCERFDGCSFGDRADTFIPLGGIWARAEGIWGQNAGYDDGHCGAIFDPLYKYFGIGYYSNLASVTTVYIRNGPPRDYPIYMASHFDETAKIPSEYYDIDDKHMTFLMGWYGNIDNKKLKTKNVYLLYQNEINEMELVFGDSLSGIYELHFNYPLEGCEPYSFIVITDNNTLYRLPEDNKYFYGTSWVELEEGVPNKPGIDYPNCNENHYFRDSRENNQWIAGGGYNLTKNNITYIDHNNCIGCSKISGLLTVYESFISNGYTITTQNPTANPTNRNTLPPVTTTYTPTTYTPTTYTPTTYTPTAGPDIDPVTPSPITYESTTKTPTASTTNSTTNTEQCTMINDIWDDNYNTNPKGVNGWDVQDETSTQIKNSITEGSINSYYGPFYGKNSQSNYEQFAMNQIFCCVNNELDIFVSYRFVYCGLESNSRKYDADYLSLYVNNIEIDKTIGNPNDISYDGKDLILESVTKCKTDWKYIDIGPFTIENSDEYQITFVLSLNSRSDLMAITNIRIGCIDDQITSFKPTESTTSRPTTLLPTTRSTFEPTQKPTLEPTSKYSCDRYEVSKSFKMKINTDSDEEHKEDQIEKDTQYILSTNSNCNNYTRYIKEEQIKKQKKILLITTTICFHCDIDQSKYDVKSDNNAMSGYGWSKWTDPKEYNMMQWIIFSAVNIFITCYLIMCCLFCWIKCRKKNQKLNNHHELYTQNQQNAIHSTEITEIAHVTHDNATNEDNINFINLKKPNKSDDDDEDGDVVKTEDLFKMAYTINTRNRIFSSKVYDFRLSKTSKK